MCTRVPTKSTPMRPTRWVDIRRLVAAIEARRRNRLQHDRITSVRRCGAPHRSSTGSGTPARPAPSRSPNTHPATTPPDGGPDDARCATTLSPQQPSDGSYAPNLRNRQPAQSATTASPTSAPLTWPPARRPARSPDRNCEPAQPEVAAGHRPHLSTTRLTVLCVMPHSSAAPRYDPTC
jgi:hypothetical protein